MQNEGNDGSMTTPQPRDAGITMLRCCYKSFIMVAVKQDCPMEAPGMLTPEQEFKLQVMREQVKTLDLPQAQDYIVDLLRQSMLKDNLMKHLIK